MPAIQCDSNVPPTSTRWKYCNPIALGIHESNMRTAWWRNAGHCIVIVIRTGTCKAFAKPVIDLRTCNMQVQSHPVPTRYCCAREGNVTRNLGDIGDRMNSHGGGHFCVLHMAFVVSSIYHYMHVAEGATIQQYGICFAVISSKDYSGWVSKHPKQVHVCTGHSCAGKAELNRASLWSCRPGL